MENAAVLAGGEVSTRSTSQGRADFKNGARRSACLDSYVPTDLMIDVAKHASEAEVTSAAAYFSQQRPIQRVRVFERVRVPRSHVVGWVYAAIPGVADELLGERLLEFAPDPELHEARDDEIQYIAYVPRGSLRRGRSIALTGAGGLTVACVSCHGERLQGVGSVPRIAGRSPTYLIRQLFAFRNGRPCWRDRTADAAGRHTTEDRRSDRCCCLCGFRRAVGPMRRQLSVGIIMAEVILVRPIERADYADWRSL
jgi:cytochrome c553